MIKISFLNKSYFNDAGNDPAAGNAKYKSKYREMVAPAIGEKKPDTNLLLTFAYFVSRSILFSDKS